MHATLWLVWPSLVWAVLVDLNRREIPNTASLLLLAVGIAGCWWGDPLSWTDRCVGLALGLGIGVLAFSYGLWGGGDAKLLAGLGTVLGVSGTTSMLIYSLLIGGIVSVVAARRGASEIAYAPIFAAGYAVWQLLTATAPRFFGMLPTPWS